MLDLRSKCCDEAVIGPEDLQPFGKEIKPGDIVILWTGWGAKKWNAPDLSYWFKSPTLSPEGAKWLVSRKPKAIVFDCFEDLGARKLDFIPEDFAMHRVILGADIIILEGVTNLDKLSKRRFLFCGAPLKVMNAEAAPARFFAIED